MTAPTFTLNNGVAIPMTGFGVFQTPPDQAAAVVQAALETGYRHIDTAAAYANERGVGEALRASGVPRDDVFIETKVWISDYGYDKTLHAFDKATGKLGVEHLDLLILHQPLPEEFDVAIAAYRALEKLLADGLVRAIGVSNFLPDQLDRLLADAQVVPAVNQVEIHPYFRNTATLEANARHGILSQAWSPIGGITFYPGQWSGTNPSVLDDLVLARIGAAHGKSPAQVMLRWHLQQGRQTIPKTVHPERMAENLDIFDFELTAAELVAIDALDTGIRGGPDPQSITLAAWGRDIPEA